MRNRSFLKISLRNRVTVRAILYMEMMTFTAPLSAIVWQLWVQTLSLEDRSIVETITVHEDTLRPMRLSFTI